jgi:hypothetical protein
METQPGKSCVGPTDSRPLGSFWERYTCELPEGGDMTIYRDRLLTDCIAVVRQKLNLPFPEINFEQFPRQLNLLEVTKAIGRKLTLEQAEWDSAETESEHPGQKSFIAAIKNCLVAADIAGSALPPEDHSEIGRRSAVINGFANRPTSDELRQVVRDRLTN